MNVELPAMSSIAHPLYFCRHGQTDWNARSLYQGSTDTRLSERGRDEARQNGLLLKGIVKEANIAATDLHIVSSPLLRARETADIVAAQISPSPKVSTNHSFRELSMGRWEGLTSPQVKERFYEERKSRKPDRWSFKPTGGDSMADRCEEVEQALSSLKPNTLLVTHCVVLRIIFHLLTDLDKQAASSAPVPHVAIWGWNSAKLHRQA